MHVLKRGDLFLTRSLRYINGLSTWLALLSVGSTQNVLGCGYHVR